MFRVAALAMLAAVVVLYRHRTGNGCVAAALLAPFAVLAVAVLARG